MRTCYFSQAVYTRETGQANPQVRVNFGVPVTGYINPVQNKADRFQGSGTAPFVIVLDVNQLPDAFNELRRELPRYFPAWEHVSGVLIFQSTSSFSKIGWTIKLLPNPHAHNPLSSGIVEKLHGSDPSTEVWANLTGKE